MPNTLELASVFAPLTDEKFAVESKKELLTNNDISFTGAKSVKVYKISTGTMNDYDRAGTGANCSRFGAVESLSATTEEMMLKNDRSFTFAIDRLDEDETAQQLAGASALERQLREVVIPEVDAYVYRVMCENAGHKPEPIKVNHDNLYSEITRANAALDDAAVPEIGRVVLLSPAAYRILKNVPDMIQAIDLTNESYRTHGVIGMLDGCLVIKVPSCRLPENFGFMVAHPSATVAPTKLEDFRMHQDPPGISGTLVEGRIVYDCFVLENKADAIYYQEFLPEESA